MKHVYLSPHLDDAVLSCGGAIHRYTAAGEQVRVITFFCGEAAPDGDLSSFAQEQHRYWGNPRRPMALRRAEDTASLTLLGAEAQHLDYLDAVYRATVGGEWLYTNLETLFGKVHPGDPVTAAALAERVTGAVPREPHLTVYAPLAAGRHVDHQIVHQAARQLLDQGYRLAFYEDYPYAERPGAVEVALAAAGADNWHSESLALSAADLAAKVAALGYCRSQMAILFGGAEAMPNRVWAFAASRTTGGGLAERLWWL